MESLNIFKFFLLKLTNHIKLRNIFYATEIPYLKNWFKKNFFLQDNLLMLE